jgi:hypothetical protein
MMVQLLFICVAAPFTLCFAVDYEMVSLLGAIDTAINVSFALDIWLNFRTGICGVCAAACRCRRLLWECGTALNKFCIASTEGPARHISPPGDDAHPLLPLATHHVPDWKQQGRGCRRRCGLASCCLHQPPLKRSTPATVHPAPPRRSGARPPNLLRPQALRAAVPARLVHH